jgi:hypothetical protein
VFGGLVGKFLAWDWGIFRIAGQVLWLGDSFGVLSAQTLAADSAANAVGVGIRLAYFDSGACFSRMFVLVLVKWPRMSMKASDHVCFCCVAVDTDHFESYLQCRNFGFDFVLLGRNCLGLGAGYFRPGMWVTPIRRMTNMVGA